jgi:acetyltransferase
LAIRPYPVELEEPIEWDGRCLTIRPIRPEDEHAHAEFFRAMTQEDLRLRFFAMTRQPDHTQLARYVQIDYDREMAFVACTEEGGSSVIHGVVRAVCDPDNETAEFAVTVRSDETGHHLGRMLMDRIIGYCRTRGTRVMTGEILRENTRMLKLAFDCGFVVEPSEDFSVTSVRRVLNA